MNIEQNDEFILRKKLNDLIEDILVFFEEFVIENDQNLHNSGIEFKQTLLWLLDNGLDGLHEKLVKKG